MRELDENERIRAGLDSPQEPAAEIDELSMLLENDGLRYERLLDIEEEVNGL